MQEKYHDFVQMFKGLADETRLKILDMLSAEELCACKILEAFEITQPTLSYHMKILVDSGVVESRQQGKWTNYRLCAAGCERARALLAAVTTPNETAVDEACGE